jgi:dethiobiotin synthetase
MRRRVYFVTGTDTGVGKTWVSCRMLEAWRASGLRVAGLKAAESGCVDGIGEDDVRLFEAAGAWQPERCGYKFEPAIAPGVAAEQVGVTIDFGEIAKQVQRLDADRVLVEGAGGWLAPMGQGRTVETMATELGYEVIVAARAGLGTINHSALTARAIRDAGLRVAAVILSLRPDDSREFAAENAVEIARIVDVPVAIVGDAATVISSLDL